MKNISLTEPEFEKIVLEGSVQVGDLPISLDYQEILTISHGATVCLNNGKNTFVCLRDIGFNRIKKILKKGNYDNIFDSN